VPDGMCQVCGNGIETGQHDVVGCTKIATLWKEMRRELILPDEKQLQDIGPDWLLILLSRLDQPPKGEDTADYVEGLVPAQ
jgi:hypothetical protein